MNVNFEKDDISCYVHCKGCISAQNPNGELFVFTKAAGLRLTDKNIENNLKFVPIDKANMTSQTELLSQKTDTDPPSLKPSEIEPAIQFEIKPLFGDEELPIENAYIQYILK